MRGCPAVQLVNHVLQFFDVASCRRLYQISHAPEVLVTPAAIAGSAAERVVTLDEVVIGEVQANRRLKVLALLAERQREASKRRMCRRVVAFRRST